MTELAERLMQEVRERPQQFSELVLAHMDVPWREFLKAWGELRAAEILARDDDGRYLIAESE